MAKLQTIFGRLVNYIVFKYEINNHLLDLVRCSKISELEQLLNSLHENRRVVMFSLIHVVITMAIWFYFAFNKFRAQEGKVPFGANRYWWKLLLPPLEFGSMHAILFQIALLPLSICRFTLAQLSHTPPRKYVPFNKTTAMHIHLG